MKPTEVKPPKQPPAEPAQGDLEAAWSSVAHAHGWDDIDGSALLNAARDGIAWKLLDLTSDLADRGASEQELAEARETADAVLAASYTAPQSRADTVETVDELKALPVGCVVRSAAATIAARFDDTRGVLFGAAKPLPWDALRPPLTVLWRPEVVS